MKNDNQEFNTGMIYFVADYYGYDYEEVSQWDKERIIKSYNSALKEIKDFEE